MIESVAVGSAAAEAGDDVLPTTAGVYVENAGLEVEDDRLYASVAVVGRAGEMVEDLAIDLPVAVVVVIGLVVGVVVSSLDVEKRVVDGKQHMLLVDYEKDNWNTMMEVLLGEDLGADLTVALSEEADSDPVEHRNVNHKTGVEHKMEEVDLDWEAAVGYDSTAVEEADTVVEEQEDLVVGTLVRRREHSCERQ